jgi:hypothetical protein
MSLYRFFESYIEENPELITMKALKSVSSNDLRDYFTNKQKRLPIETFFDILFHTPLMMSSRNLFEYEILRIKTRRIATIADKLYHNVAIKEAQPPSPNL